jgi:hypothetical protein
MDFVSYTVILYICIIKNTLKYTVNFAYDGKKIPQTNKKQKNMKTISLKTTIVSVLLAGIFSCSNNDETESGIVQIKDMNYELCKIPTYLSSIIGVTATEQINCYATNNNTLKFEQELNLNCCLDSLHISLIGNENIITIDELDYGERCNCICSSNINFSVTNLIPNTNYKFIIKRNSQNYYTCNVLFNNSCSYIFVL